MILDGIGIHLPFPASPQVGRGRIVEPVDGVAETLYDGHRDSTERQLEREYDKHLLDASSGIGQTGIGQTGIGQTGIGQTVQVNGRLIDVYA